MEFNDRGTRARGLDGERERDAIVRGTLLDSPRWNSIIFASGQRRPLRNVH